MRHELALDMQAQKDGVTYETGAALKVAQKTENEKTRT